MEGTPMGRSRPRTLALLALVGVSLIAPTGYFAAPAPSRRVALAAQPHPIQISANSSPNRRKTLGLR